MNKYLVFFICSFSTLFGVDNGIDLTVQSHLGAGFFCEFLKVIDNIVYYNQIGIKRISVDWTQEFFPYKDDPVSNGWDLYFEFIKCQEYSNDFPLTKVINTSRKHALFGQLDIHYWPSYDSYLSYRLAVHDKINEYIRIKQHITEEVQTFYEKHMKGHHCIGVHVRYAGAHSNEVPGGPPTLSAYIETARKMFLKNQKTKIFLATDSQYVVEQFQKNFPKNRILVIDAFRAKYQEDPHLIYDNTDYWIAHPEEFHKLKPGYFGGKTVLMDCLLLAKCDCLIHTMSNVSSCCCFFNPYISSIYLTGEK